MLLLPWLLLAAGAHAGHRARAAVEIRREGSIYHRRIAELADTGKTPPAAVGYAAAAEAADPGDFGQGLVRACGCAGTLPRVLRDGA